MVKDKWKGYRDCANAIIDIGTHKLEKDVESLSEIDKVKILDNIINTTDKLDAFNGCSSCKDKIKHDFSNGKFANCVGINGFKAPVPYVNRGYNNAVKVANLSTINTMMKRTNIFTYPNTKKDIKSTYQNLVQKKRSININEPTFQQKIDAINLKKRHTIPIKFNKLHLHYGKLKMTSGEYIIEYINKNWEKIIRILIKDGFIPENSEFPTFNRVIFKSWLDNDKIDLGGILYGLSYESIAKFVSKLMVLFLFPKTKNYGTAVTGNLYMHICIRFVKSI
jgi:hypothetical protein